MDGVYSPSGLAGALVVVKHERAHELPHTTPSLHDLAELRQRKRELLQEIFERFERRHRSGEKAFEIEARRHILQELDQRWRRIEAGGSVTEVLSFVQGMLGAFNRMPPHSPEHASKAAAGRSQPKEEADTRPPTTSTAASTRRVTPEPGAGSPEEVSKRYSYGDMFEVVLYGCTQNGAQRERLSVNYVYMDPLFGLILGGARPPGSRLQAPRLVLDWHEETGWLEPVGRVAVPQSHARELVDALKLVTARDFDSTYPDGYVQDCLRCAAAVCEFIERQQAAGFALWIENV
ncbi:hypothetical protein [Piscinibacter koreensis]|uniref:hypothetical protein n=1 Tax=Piscinibacter koreensis TaxID=2742824 RepID=UPI001592AA76|nr:hypothetical protein [Schlegelella koreensis]